VGQWSCFALLLKGHVYGDYYQSKCWALELMYTIEPDNHEHNQQHGYHSLLDNPFPRLISNDLFK